MSIKKRFKNTRPNTTYIFKNTKVAHFMQDASGTRGVYDTDNPEEIEELTKEATVNSNPHIHIDPADTEIDTEALTPYQVMEAKIRKQIEAENALKASIINEPVKDMGTSDPGKLVMQNSAGVSGAAGESTSGDGVPTNVTTEVAAASAQASQPSAAAAALLAKMGK